MELKKCKIKDICNINSSSISSKDKIEEIIYLDTSNLTQNEINSLQPFSFENAPSRAQRKVKHNTILYSSVRPNLKHYGILSNPEEHMIVSSGFITLDIKTEKVEEYDAMFLYYILTQDWVTSYLQTIAENSVSAYPSINANDLGNLCFSFPNINSQRKIAKSLSNLDRKISLNRSINQNLENLAKQIYDYWFVQFDFPDENGRPYKSSGGKMVWNEKLKRNIPEGWHCGNLFEIATFTNGLACQNNRPKEGEDPLPVIKIREMRDGFTADSEYVSPNIPEAVRVYNGDILFSWSASLEVMLWCYGNGGLNQHIFKVTPANDFPKSFYYYQLLDYVSIFKKMAEARKTTMGHITQDHLKQSTIAIPDDIAITNKLEEIISPIFNKIVKVHEEITELTKQRDELLPLLMNGQVTIK